MVGDVPVGGEAPISVQSMTNTPTSDVEATVAQIESIQQAGADIVRVSVPSLAEAEDDIARGKLTKGRGRQSLIKTSPTGLATNLGGTQ